MTIELTYPRDVRYSRQSAGSNKDIACCIFLNIQTHDVLNDGWMSCINNATVLLLLVVVVSREPSMSSSSFNGSYLIIH